jgi:hypothetical protein
MLRLVQIAMVLALGVSVQTAEVECKDCEDAPTCYANCDTCSDPNPQPGSCSAGLEGCSYYGCFQDPYNEICDDLGICLNFCYCPPCN